MLFSAAPLRERVRVVGAASTVVVFLGAVALAPFSTSSAFATSDSISAGAAQSLTSVSADAQVLDWQVSAGEQPSPVATALYTLPQFMSAGVVNWGGYKFTYYSEQVLPGSGLQIPGRHLNADGYVSDADGYIVLAGSAAKGTVYETPFGHPGKIYDRGTSGNHLDVYIR